MVLYPLKTSIDVHYNTIIVVIYLVNYNNISNNKKETLKEVE